MLGFTRPVFFFFLKNCFTFIDDIVVTDCRNCNLVSWRHRLTMSWRHRRQNSSIGHRIPPNDSVIPPGDLAGMHPDVARRNANADVAGNIQVVFRSKRNLTLSGCTRYVTGSSRVCTILSMFVLLPTQRTGSPSLSDGRNLSSTAGE